MVEIKEKDLVLYDGRVYEVIKLSFNLEVDCTLYREGTLVLSYFNCEDDYYNYVVSLDEAVGIARVWRKNENEDYICIYKREEN